MTNIVAFDPGYNPRQQARNIKAIKNRLWNPPQAQVSSELEVQTEATRRQAVQDQHEQILKAKEDFERALRIDNLIRKAVVERRKVRNIARRIFYDELEAQPPKVRVIVKFIAEQNGITAANILGQRRTKNLVRGRHTVMYLASTITFLSLSEIGQCLGGRDHTTVLHGVRRIEALVKGDSEFAALLDGYSRALVTGGV